MKTAAEVDQLIAQLKAEQVPLCEAIFQVARACVGWPYVYGARGGLTTKDGIRVRKFDCRGFTYWVLLQFGITIEGAGCTTQWNNEDNWRAKGDIGSIPNDILVCLFYRDDEDPRKMAHTGFGYRGETVECSSGVQYFPKRKSKWQYWAIPRGIEGGEIPVQTTKPTLRRGDKGEDVKALQQMLIDRGYDLGKWGADGSYGAQTAEAVKAFQRSCGLTADGICGPKTWAALEETDGKRFTVTIPGVTKYQAEALMKQYPAASMKEE